jgi:hypothetical protein
VTTSQRKLLWAAIAVATAIKLYLALTTTGSLDVAGFSDHLDKLRQFGVGAYRIRGAFNNPFNSPPPMIHVIRLWGWLTENTALPFGFWLRLIPTVADVGTVLIASRLRVSIAVLIALALNPVSILISAYHGNTDSLMIFFVVLAIYLASSRASGFAFGLAMCVKVVPLIFIPAFWFYLPRTRRIQFVVLAGITFLVASLPYIAQDPLAVWHSVFGYGSSYGQWGFTLLASIISPPTLLHGEFDPVGAHKHIASILKGATVMVVVLLAWCLNRKDRPDLFIQVGLITAITLFLAPGFGIQYLVWLVPFVIFLGLRAALAYYLIVTLYLLRAYFCIAGSCTSVVLSLLAHLTCWLAMLFVAARFYRVREPGAPRNIQRAKKSSSRGQVSSQSEPVDVRSATQVR